MDFENDSLYKVYKKLNDKFSKYLTFESTFIDKINEEKIKTLDIKVFPVLVLLDEAEKSEILAEGFRPFEEIEVVLEIRTGTRNYEYITDPEILDQDIRYC